MLKIEVFDHNERLLHTQSLCNHDFSLTMLFIVRYLIDLLFTIKLNSTNKQPSPDITQLIFFLTIDWNDG
jgi:hypothetical protein